MTANWTPPRLSVTPSAMLRAGSALVAGLALGWTLLFVGETLSRPPTLDQPPTLEVYLAPEGMDPAEMTPGDGSRIDLPIHSSGSAYAGDYPDAVHGSISVKRFDLSTVDLEERLAAHITLTRRIVAVRLNGTRLYTASSNRSWSGNSGFFTDAYALPPELLVEGENTLVLESSTVSRIVHPGITIAPADPIMRSVWWSRFFGGLGVGMTAALLGFVALLFTALARDKRDRGQTTVVALLATAWMLYDLNTLGWPRLQAPWHTVFGYVTVSLVVAGFAAYVVGRLRSPPLAWWTLGALTLAACLVPVIAGFWGSQSVFDWAWPIEVWSKMILAPVFLLALLYILVRRLEDTSWIETSAMITCLMAMFLDGYDDRFGTTVPFMAHLPLGGYALPWFGAVFALGMSAAIATQATRARRIALDHNDILNGRLDEQQRELQTFYHREQAMARERILNEERQRLMRDMHDGIGGHLVSLMVQARAGKAAPDAMAGSLQRALDDLRLIVDSLDTAGDSLGFALGAFRRRLDPKLQEAGITLDWSVAADVAETTLGPDAVLQVLRIVQEACSNALQHAGATRIGIDVSRGEGELHVKISDNGSGFDPRCEPAGKGLINMQQRAARLGGALDIAPGAAGGTMVSVVVPLPEVVAFRAPDVSVSV